MDSLCNTAYFVRQPFRIDDLYVDRWYIEANKHFCRIGEKSGWQCILVCRRQGHDGILVMPGGTEYPKFAAYLADNAANERIAPNAANAPLLLSKEG